jgi:hypothetical protein
VAALGAPWPAGLSGVCHLDPDFAHLTDGDAGSRAQRIREFVVPGSFLVFWAGLRWLDGLQPGELVCSIIVMNDDYSSRPTTTGFPDSI